MTMKKMVFVLLSVITFDVYGGVNALRDTLLCQAVDSLQTELSDMQRKYEELAPLLDAVTRQAQEIGVLRDSNRQLANAADSLVTEVGALRSLSERQDRALRDGQHDAEDRFRRLQRAGSHVVATILIVIFLVSAGMCGQYLRSKRDRSSLWKLHAGYTELRTECSSLRDDAARLNDMLLQLIDIQTSGAATHTDSQQESHELVLKIADEIVRIETNLSHMDANVRGYRQLARAVERIKANLKANGYEIVDMLGKPYHEGMKVTANFVMDETLAEGEQRITSIIKPQINYCRKMIQAAQITVSQNL